MIRSNGKNKQQKASTRNKKSHELNDGENRSLSAKYLLNNFHEPICILDTRYSRLLYVNSAFARMIQLSVNESYDKGFNQFVSHIEPNDYFILQNKVIQRLLAYCNKLPKKSDITFSVNYRFRNGAENYNHMLQRTTVAEWKDDMPSICINIFTNLSTLGNNSTNKITLCVERLDIGADDSRAVYREDFMRQAPMLSERERSIMRLMVSGKKLDDIAEELHISYHTARAHCRNILKKTKCNSQDQLKKLATAEGWA